MALCDAFKVESFEDLPEAVQDVDLSNIFIAGRNHLRKLPFASPSTCFDVDVGDNGGRSARPWTPTPSGQRHELLTKRKEMLSHHLLYQNSVKKHIENNIEIKIACEMLINDIVYKLSEIDEQGYTLSSDGNGGNGYERPKTFGRPRTSHSVFDKVGKFFNKVFVPASRQPTRSIRGVKVSPEVEKIEDIFPPNPNIVEGIHQEEFTLNSQQDEPDSEHLSNIREEEDISNRMEIEDISEANEPQTEELELEEGSLPSIDRSSSLSKGKMDKEASSLSRRSVTFEPQSVQLADSS